jgi:hypothetical protein
MEAIVFLFFPVSIYQKTQIKNRTTSSQKKQKKGPLELHIDRNQKEDQHKNTRLTLNGGSNNESHC